MIRTDPKMFSGGAVVFDTQPNVNLFAQLMARKRAKEEALDEYDRNRINNINPTGVRDTDREGFDKRVDNLKRFYIANKDKITKGNTPESLQYEKTFRDISAYINQSKERTAKQDAAMKLYQDVLKKDGIIPDDDEGGGSFLGDLDLNDKAIDDNSKSFDLTKWMSVSQKPFNPQTHLKRYSDIKRTPGTAKYTPIDGQPLKMNEVIEEKFDIPAKKVIAERSETDYHSSLGFKRTVDAEYSNPVSRAELANVFKNEFGIEPARMEDYATAYQLSIMQPTITKSKAVDNKSAVMDRTEAHKEKMFRIAEGGRNYRATLNRVRPNLGDYDILSLYDPKVQEVEIEVKSPTEKDWLGKPKVTKEKASIIYTKDIDGNDEKYFEGASPINSANGSYYIQRSDGDYEGANGKVIQRKTAAIKFMGNPAAYKGGVINDPKNQPKAPTKSGKAKTYQGLDKDGNPIYK